jgi:hypothetical protein
MDEELSVGGLMVLEYKQLKQEQLARISTRDNLIYVTLASLAAVAAATLQLGFSSLLLLLPPACLILGWTYLANDQKVSAIGYHLRTVLIPGISEQLQTQEPLFTWEFSHRADSRRLMRKGAQLCIDLLTFCLPAITAVIVFAASGPMSGWLSAISLIELVATLLLGWAIVDNADLTREQLAGAAQALGHDDSDGPPPARS